MLLGLFAGARQAAAAEPPIWFCPMDPLLRPEVGYSGSPQYMDLFSADAPWQKAAAHIQVFKIYPQWISRATDADLQRQFADLNRRGIALALEFGVLTLPPGQKGTEGFGGETLLRAARRIHQDGGILRYVAMDEPIFFSTFYQGKNAVKWTPEQAAANAAQNIKALRSEFPDVQIGDIEPLPVVKPPRDFPELIARYQEGLRAFQKAFGFSLAFFDADLDWDSPAFPANLIAVQAMVKAEGLPFGIIYDGNPQDKSDAEWIASAERNQNAAEKFVAPDTVIFQSWHAYPKKLLPETDADSFTWMIVHFTTSAPAK